tara:strand:- start:106 stop:306 length:201 start_codon:yes stop_codon:yes gene_type:complete
MKGIDTMSKKSSLELFLRKYPNQWHSYATDYRTKNQVKKLLNKNLKGHLPFLIITNTNQMYLEIKE